MRTLDEMEPDPELTADQKRIVAGLSQGQLAEIDRAIVAVTKNQWQKVAKVIAVAMQSTPRAPTDVPDIFYSLRIRRLVDDGKLEAQGDLRRMRFSEVRRVVD
jgi:hypothetical protein